MRPTGQHGLPIRFDEPNPGCFSWYLEPHAFRYRDKGGCVPGAWGCTGPTFLKLFCFLWFVPTNRLPRADTEKSGETIATPPKRGVPTGPDSGTEYRASIRPQGVAIVCAGRLGKDAPSGVD